MNEQTPVGVIFEHHLLVPSSGEWATSMNAALRQDFEAWLMEYVGFGFVFPVRGWDLERNVKWAWYDDRLSNIDTRKWRKYGFKMLFMDPRRAVLAKLTWGGREAA